MKSSKSDVVKSNWKQWTQNDEHIACRNHAKLALKEIVDHWDEHSDANKIQRIKNVIEEIL